MMEVEECEKVGQQSEVNDMCEGKVYLLERKGKGTQSDTERLFYLRIQSDFSKYRYMKVLYLLFYKWILHF